MASPNVEIEGSEAVRVLMSEMKDRTTGVEKAWPKVGQVIADAMTEQFDTEGVRLTGKPWAPLSPPYLRWKIRKGFDPRRLHQTGAMRRSLTSRPMAIETYGPTSARFGTDDPKARFHQGGTRRMPERTILAVDEDLSDDASQVLARYIFEDRL